MVGVPCSCALLGRSVSVHGFRWYDNIAPNAKCQQVLVLTLCLVFIFNIHKRCFDIATFQCHCCCFLFCCSCYLPRHTTTVLRPFFRDYPGEPVPEENFWTLWCKGRLTEADAPTIRLGATPSRLTSAHVHHPPFFTGRMLFLPPNQQCQSTEGN